MKILYYEKILRILINCSGYVPFFIFLLCFITSEIGVPVIGECLITFALLFILYSKYLIALLCILLVLLFVAYIVRKKIVKLSNILLVATLGGCGFLLPFVLCFLYYSLTSFGQLFGLGTDGFMGIMNLILLVSGYGLTSNNRKYNNIGCLAVLIFNFFIWLSLTVPMGGNRVLVFSTVITLYFANIFTLRKVVGGKIFADNNLAQ